jgi:hypothetical protein
VRHPRVRSPRVQGESGQATVEWVALILMAALALGAAAALSGHADERGLGDLVAKRIASATASPAAAPPAASGPAAPPAASGPAAPAAAAPAAPTPAAAPPPASRPRAVDAFRRLRGVADVAKHTWIVCLGYRRWRYELENPSAPTESLPLGEALRIVNSCFNPYDFLLED